VAFTGFKKQFISHDTALLRVTQHQTKGKKYEKRISLNNRGKDIPAFLGQSAVCVTKLRDSKKILKMCRLTIACAANAEN